MCPHFAGKETARLSKNAQAEIVRQRGGGVNQRPSKD